MINKLITNIYKPLKNIFLFIIFVTYSTVLSATEWPQELSGDKGAIVIYQPQPEKLQGNILTGRAAMQLELKNNSEPVFGVFWFSSTIDTDRDTDSVVIENIKVTRVGWPDSKDSDEQFFTEFVEKELENSSFSGSLSNLTATLASAEKVEESLKDIKNDPPVIIFKNQLSLLLNYDGKPIFKDIENSPYQRALNTPFAVAKVKNKQQYYLTSGSLWYQATNELGPWQTTVSAPADLVAMVTKYNEENIQNKPQKAPEIITVTKATELVVSDGKPNWVSLAGGKLLYVKNTETPWVRDIASGDMYILLSGRWFKSKSEQGTWTFVRADKLPKSFKEIPPESAIGGLRSSVAGTEEAEQAVLDSQIPQTAAIKRSEASLTVEYYGEPEFEHIKGTEVDYAVNTNTQVLRISGKFYAVDEGVWFVANSAKGAWVVADTIPTAAIKQIPPSSPVYNTTYVKVYDSTPDVVYVGYTPGYMWSYAYYGVPIYGTGWYYPPYYGGWYYPRPPTWGMHAGYNPWTGWNVGVSWGGPFFSVGINWGGGYHNHPRGGFYGGGYGGRYHGVYHGGHNSNININGNINIGNSISIGNNGTIKKNIGNRPGNKTNNNLYNKSNIKNRNAIKQRVNQPNRAKVAPNRANNVFSDKAGNVVRHQDGQWQSRTKQNWNTIPQQQNKVSSKPSFNYGTQGNQSTRSIKNRSSGFDHSSMNRTRQARNMGGRMSGGAMRSSGRR